MGASNDQIDIQTKSSFRKTRAFLKRMTSKLLRRQAKKMLEDAPPVNKYSGWIS